MRRLAIATFTFAVTLASSVSAQEPAPPSADVRFEVASVKPISAQAAAGRTYRAPPGGFTSALPVAMLVPMAYRLDSYRIVGLPAWTETERDEINAKTPAVRQSGDLWVMLRHLLEDRFSLRVHRETRPMPVYALVKARPGSRRRQSSHSRRPVFVRFPASVTVGRRARRSRTPAADHRSGQ